MTERWELSFDRLLEVKNENILREPYGDYFRSVAGFMTDTISAIEGFDTLNAAQKAELNKAHYSELLGSAYDNSYLNPASAVKRLGEFGQLLSFLYTEIRGIIPYMYEIKRDERRQLDIIILMELFLEVYSCFAAAEEENALPQVKEIRDILYYFVSDYADVIIPERIQEQLDPEIDFALNIIMNADLTDTEYLYSFGEYITENELETSRYLAAMSQDKIDAMASTYTEGYRIGFVTTGKDLSKKSSVNIRYVLGFERVVRAAVLQFERLGLKSIIYREPAHLLSGSTVSRLGYYGAIANRQYDYDHKEDMALFLDKALKDRRLELTREAYEAVKSLANGHAGPAVMETFGENPFDPVSKPEACAFNEKQKKLSVEYAAAAGAIVNEYIKGEERSFTIIAYPIPEIGEFYSEIFEETVKLNTLDYMLYRDMQQKLIDVLDRGISARITGKNGNRTNLTVALRALANPDKETQFENCVADVNIPVGEVFTTPVLEGTNGVLHVSQVYLNGLKFTDFSITFRDGWIEDYSCSNFKDEEQNKKYIRDNVLFNHEKLPMGEFAVGTNTVAYVMAKKYNIFDRLPILIAEKTGPHFAVGDTCYSHAEDVAVYNPDGKEIVSRDNTCSLKRKTKPEEAYFNCHTDITIPYDELSEISVCDGEGNTAYIIRNGLFAVEGCEELNKPLEV